MLHDLYLAHVEGGVYGRTFFIGMIKEDVMKTVYVSTLHDPGKVDKEKEVSIFSWTLLPHMLSECHAWHPVLQSNLEHDHSHLKGKLLITLS